MSVIVVLGAIDAPDAKRNSGGVSRAPTNWVFGGVINVESIIWSAITLSFIVGMLLKALPRVPGAVVGTAWGATALAATGALLFKDTTDTNLEIVSLGLIVIFPAFLTGFALVSLVGDWKRELTA
ncbi:hypothetical protein [Brevibacterium aurantiacum]|uniref:hypothetical protein n=1 Tax=Brevibacterium aurantiacum TaxID=273384 RepID=UPI0011AEE43D|nr:hypothetical protein [Brevibacterium aurantiacum]